MAWQFRRTISLGGGVRTTLSKRGVSTSWGLPGLRITRSAEGRYRLTLSLPGTGMSYRRTLGKPGAQPVAQPSVPPHVPSPTASRPGQGGSASPSASGGGTPGAVPEAGDWWRQFDGG